MLSRPLRYDLACDLHMMVVEGQDFPDYRGSCACRDGHLFSLYLMLPLAAVTLALLVFNWYPSQAGFPLILHDPLQQMPPVETTCDACFHAGIALAACINRDEH